VSRYAGTAFVLRRARGCLSAFSSARRVQRWLMPVLVLAALTPQVLPAQYGASFAVRSVSGRDADPTVGQRGGFELRALWDGGRRDRAIGWRVELAGAQVQYQANYQGDRVQISENSIELAGLLRAEIRGGALAGMYGLIGPVASRRLNCGVLGGFVDCVDDRASAVGAAFGIGYTVMMSPRASVIFELRGAHEVVGGAGNPTISLGVGLRAR